MQFQFLPEEKITISTTKSREKICEAIAKGVGHQYASKTRVDQTDNGFVIIRNIDRRYQASITAQAAIEEKTDKNLIYIHLFATENILRFALAIWCIINIAMFLLGIYALMVKHQFDKLIFIPPISILLGYGIMKSTLQGAIDELMDDIIKSLK